MLKISINSETLRKYGLLMLLICGTALVFYACKKGTKEPLAPYASEMQTYHLSNDYKNLQKLYPNGLFQDMPIIEANTRMKAIITKIVSSSGEVVTAMTYFEPEKDRQSNTWYPTVVFRLKGQNEVDLNKMLNQRNFSGSIEIGTTGNVILREVKLENSQLVSEISFAEGLNKSFVKMSGLSRSKLMVVDESGGLLECLKAADVCATNKFKDLGYIELAVCLIAPTPCMATLYGDCFLHEKACLGIEKPIATVIS